MDLGIFNLMGARQPDKPTAQVFGEVGEVAEQTRRPTPCQDTPITVG